MGEVFADGVAYERFMGRWSRQVAQEFVRELGVPSGSAWADVGCGTGALTQTVLDACSPRSIVGLDPSPGQVAVARRSVVDPRFLVAGAQELDSALDEPVDAVVCGLVLNFVPDAAAAVALMRRAAPAGLVAAYLWDGQGDGHGMQQLDLFEQAAAAVVPGALGIDGGRARLGRPEVLEELWLGAGLTGVRSWPVEVPLTYRDPDELWGLFLSGVGPAGQFLLSLDEPVREQVRAGLLEIVPTSDDGKVRLSARAWAVAGRS
jgi:SAM-dependent methyltransferase